MLGLIIIAGVGALLVIVAIAWACAAAAGMASRAQERFDARAADVAEREEGFRNVG